MIKPSISYSTLLLILMSFFVLADLHFASHDNSCIRLQIVNAKIGISLQRWLTISGFSAIVFLLFPIVGCILTSFTPLLLVIYMVFTVLYAFFRIIWVIIGGIIFWGYLWKQKLCESSLNIYMWINLIYNFLIVFILCFNQQQIFTTVYVSKPTISW